MEHPRGVWIWYLDKLRYDYLDKLQARNCRRVYLKVVDGSRFWGFQCRREVIEQFHNEGIEVYGWGYHYGRANVDAQKNAIQQAMDCGLDGYIFDLESEVEDPRTHDDVKRLLQAVRPLVARGTLGYTSFGHPGFHPRVPWKLLDDICDLAFPQMYFEKWRFDGDDRGEVAQALEAHQRLGLRNPILPIFGSESDASHPATVQTLQSFLDAHPGSSLWRAPNRGERGNAWELNYKDKAYIVDGGPDDDRVPAAARFTMVLEDTEGLVLGNIFLFDQNGRQIFDAVAVSGRPGYQSADDLWNVGQGPIPNFANLHLVTEGINGIESSDIVDQFFSILPRTLENPDNSQETRGGFGVYNDGGNPGTPGGIGILNSNTFDRFCELMDNARRAGMGQIPLEIQYNGQSRSAQRQPARALFRMKLRNTSQLVTGHLFLFDGNGNQIFDAVTTSGLPGTQSLDDIWKRARGPIPNNQAIINGPIQINTNGYYLSHPGIAGMFFAIDPIIFRRRSDGYTRSEFGVHHDANVPGSAGCVVIRNRNSFNRFTNIMKKARRAGINRIPLEIDYAGSRGLVMIGDSRPKGMAINIGLNQVDPHAYQGWDGQLYACENDARAMAAIARQQGFSSQLLLTKEATVEAVQEVLLKAAHTLNTDDILLLTYSGHGSQVPDVNGDETDNLDETMVLYDRQMIDDELYNLFRQFKPGVRILFISDSCHSGTLARVPDLDCSVPENTPIRTMPSEFRNRNYHARQNLYQQIRQTNPKVEARDIGASVILLAACQDNQLAYEAGQHGNFTQALLDTWNNGQFNRDYVKFHREIRQRMPGYQSPNYYVVGSSTVEFEGQIPFTIDANGQRQPSYMVQPDYDNGHYPIPPIEAQFESELIVVLR